MPRLHCECGKFMKQDIDRSNRVFVLDATCICGAKLHLKTPLKL